MITKSKLSCYNKYVEKIFKQIYMHTKYLSQLKNLGIKEKEARVYLAGLELGPTKINQLAKKTKLKRTTIYDVVKKLIDLGLFKIDISNSKKTYIAQSPKKIKTLFENQIDKLISDLDINIFNASTIEPDQIHYYRGINGIKTAHLSMLENLKPNDFYFVFGETTRWLKADEKFSFQFLKKRAKLKLDLKLVLISSKEAKFLKQFEKNFNLQVKLISNKTRKVDVCLSINPYKILLNKLTEPKTAIIINSPEIAQMCHTVLSIIWQAL